MSGELVELSNVFGLSEEELRKRLEEIKFILHVLQHKDRDETDKIEILNEVTYWSSCDRFELPNSLSDITHYDEYVQSTIMTSYAGPVEVKTEVNDGMLFLDILPCEFQGTIADLENCFKYFVNCLGRRFSTFKIEEAIIKCKVSGVPKDFMYSCGKLHELKEGVSVPFIPYEVMKYPKYVNGKFI